MKAQPSASASAERGRATVRTAEVERIHASQGYLGNYDRNRAVGSDHKGDRGANFGLIDLRQ